MILYKVVEVFQVLESGCLLVDEAPLLLDGRFLTNWNRGELSINHSWIKDGSVLLGHSELLFYLSDELLKRDTNGGKIKIVVQTFNEVKLLVLFCSDFAPKKSPSCQVLIK